MLTNDDKKFILDTITVAITQNSKVLEKRFDSIDKRFNNIDKRFDDVDKKFNSIDKSLNNLAEEMVELFTVTNKRIEKVNENLGDKIDAINGVIVNHEHRIEKIEEKNFPISA